MNSRAVYRTILERAHFFSLHSRLRSLALTLIVAAVAILLYMPTWRFDYTYLDDNDLILKRQPFFSNPASLYRVFGEPFFCSASDTYYRPVVNLSYAINALCGGTQPFGYHLVNSLLHAVACMLILALLRRLDIGDSASLFAALFFTVHPVNVASVAWIPGRNDVLLGCLTLGASLFLLKDAHHPSAAAKTGHLICFLLALYTKETAACLPLVFIFLLRAGEDGYMPSHRRWMWAGWIGAMVLYFTARHVVITSPPGYITGQLQRTWQRWPEFLSGVGKLLLPLRLQVLASPHDILWWPGVVVITIVGVVCLISKMRRRISALALSLITFPLLISLLGARNVTLETRLYIPVIGACIFIAEFLQMTGLYGKRVVNAAFTIIAVLCVALGVVNLRHARSFRDRDRFSRAAIEGSPNSGIAANLRFKTFYHKDIRGQKPRTGSSTQ
ncbi:MAG: glycosyltransferase family 39 protein [Chitinispirillaceae bacterium]|nr:glycosyltransferase family 39 protein [Chitinispirillaceae bacterium]